MVDFEEIKKVMEEEDCEEIKKVIKEGFGIFLANTGIDEKVDGDDTVIRKIENNFKENKEKLINDEEKFQEKFEEIKSELSENEESIKKYFAEILKNKDPTTIMALHSYYIETLKSHVDKFKSLQIGGNTFTNPESGVLGTTNDGLVKEGNESIPEAYKNAVVVPEKEEFWSVVKSALYYIGSFSLMGMGIAVAGPGTGGLGILTFCFGLLLGGAGYFEFDIAKDKFIDDFQGLSEEKLRILANSNKKLPPNGLIRGAFGSIFSNLKVRVKNIPSATKNFMSHTEASKIKTGETQSGGEIDDKLCKSIQNFMKDNDILNKLKEIENPQEEQKKDLNPFEKLTAQFNEQRKGTDEAIKKAEGYLPRDKQGGRRMRKVKGKSLKKRGGRKSIKKGVKKVVKKGGRKSVRKTLNKRGRKSVRR